MNRDFDKFREIPKLAIKFSNTIFIFGIIFSILFTVYSIYQCYVIGIQIFYIIFIITGLIFSILFYYGLKINNYLKFKLSLIVFSIVISFYFFEIFLEFNQLNTKTNVQIAKQEGIDFDNRNTIDVLIDLNESGIEAYPNFYPGLLMRDSSTLNGIYANQDKVLPFGGISNITTTWFDKESGNYAIIKTDEHGFNNPKGLYNKEIDIVLLGDSFVEGVSVNANKNISAYLRQSGLTTINSGKKSIGPLMKLAILKEYAEPLKPKIVLWQYFVNDYNILKTFEINSSLLMQYLNENDFSQNLILRQDKIDYAIKDYLDKKLSTKKIKNEETSREELINFYKDFLKIFPNILKLTYLRSELNLKPKPMPKPEKEKELEIFKRILIQSKKNVSEWGGELYFVYLPSSGRYKTGGNEYEIYEFRDYIFNMVNELNIPMINIHNEVFFLQDDPLSLFPFRTSFHYSSQGYQLVAEAIAERLKLDNIILSNKIN